jgi:hypothetical protein
MAMTRSTTPATAAATYTVSTLCSRSLRRPTRTLRHTRDENRWDRRSVASSTTATAADRAIQPHEPQKRTAPMTGAARRRTATTTRPGRLGPRSTAPDRTTRAAARTRPGHPTRCRLDLDAIRPATNALVAALR